MTKVNWRLALAIFLAVVVPIVLAHLYRLVAIAGWLAPTVVNSFLVIVTVRYWRLAITSVSAVYYLPSLGLLTCYLVAVALSSHFGTATSQQLAVYHLLPIFWVPVIEELLFRVFVGNYLRALAGNFWGCYCSVICFALVHSLPTIERVIALDIGLALGPLLLASVCEYLYLKSGSILPAILFHAVANSSAVIFMFFDSRWLSWLAIFYQ